MENAGKCRAFCSGSLRGCGLQDEAVIFSVIALWLNGNSIDEFNKFNVTHWWFFIKSTSEEISSWNDQHYSEERVQLRLCINRYSYFYHAHSAHLNITSFNPRRLRIVWSKSIVEVSKNSSSKCYLNYWCQNIGFMYGPLPPLSTWF